MRGVPDIALQASSRHRRARLPDAAAGRQQRADLRQRARAAPAGTTSAAPRSSCPQWAGLVAIADQINGGGLGLINPALYTLAPTRRTYANDFFDVTTGNNQADPSVPGYPATTGWDPVTGLGTPNAAHLIPDLVAASF